MQKLNVNWALALFALASILRGANACASPAEDLLREVRATTIHISSTKQVVATIDNTSESSIKISPYISVLFKDQGGNIFNESLYPDDRIHVSAIFTKENEEPVLLRGEGTAAKAIEIHSHEKKEVTLEPADDLVSLLDHFANVDIQVTFGNKVIAVVKLHHRGEIWKAD